MENVLVLCNAFRSASSALYLLGTGIDDLNTLTALGPGLNQVTVNLVLRSFNGRGQFRKQAR
jgi:hypothetical protein